ncbi:DUF2218 domain-containing protein [Chenggangzhangella methanolivorans]|uniref:DUF2218 domain-containing protein n=1 Tax=Chenggangzhangella methanolivorans TaxID=1437009 RepID=A0A9E6R732_9HYPH|nr:DUF2218 domain-containing protein [Chenggangzhangella methanolivorans]QZN99034.1 DUF2218 domain-containing protein [Chenggangzhangella methanolivorans]
MDQRRAIVVTPSGSRMLQQLCKHWSHKFEVAFTPAHGEISLPMGRCEMDATDDSLTVVVSAVDPGDAPRLQKVVEEHLRRFAFREDLTFDWTDAQGVPVAPEPPEDQPHG